jgi:hypothetical protein
MKNWTRMKRSDGRPGGKVSEDRPYMRLTIRVTEVARKGTVKVRGRRTRTRAQPVQYVVLDVGYEELARVVSDDRTAKVEIMAWGRYETPRAKNGEEHRLILALVKASDKVNARVKD